MRFRVTALTFALAVMTAPTSRGQVLLTRLLHDRTVQSGARVLFKVEAAGDAPLRYQWQFNGTDLPGATRDSLVMIATPARGGTYAVRITDGSGFATNTQAQLAVLPRPVFLIQPRDNVVALYGTATFTTKLNASAPYTRLIWHNSNPLEGSHEIPNGLGYAVNQPIFVLPNCFDTPSYNGLYWLAATNAVGGAISRVARLTVVGPPVLIIEPRDVKIRNGGAAVLRTLAARDAAPAFYQWYKDGAPSAPIMGATRATLALSNVKSSDSGLYYCLVRNIGGETVTRGANVTVVP